jgi:predicted TIM-barrel fold metal-dependent hydrolase
VKPAKRSVAVVVRRGDGAFLIVRRPDDRADPLAGAWGFPAITMTDGETERDAAVRTGRVKLGVELAVGAKLGERSADRGGYLQNLTDYEATVISGVPSVPQPDASMTQYDECAFTTDADALSEAAARGSLCAQVFLEHLIEGGTEKDNSKKRSAGDQGASEPATQAEHEAGTPVAQDIARVAEFRRRNGLDGMIDVHTHFMPERLHAAVQAYFAAGGPLIGQSWPIAYRQDESTRVALLRAFGVTAFTAMLYPHKPGMARSLNDWAADFAARTPGCLHTATFFAEPGAAGDVRRAVGQGARVFKCHLQVGDFDPNDPLLDDVWGLLAENGIPVVTHCGNGPVPGRYTGPEPVAKLLARHPALRLVIAHLGMPQYADFLTLAERHQAVLLDTTLAFTPFAEGGEGAFPAPELTRLRDIGDRILLGTDFPNIPHSYAVALESLERLDLGGDWIRAVCHGNPARLFAL